MYVDLDARVIEDAALESFDALAWAAGERFAARLFDRHLEFFVRHFGGIAFRIHGNNCAASRSAPQCGFGVEQGLADTATCHL